jgi:hypothetical protein
MDLLNKKEVLDELNKLGIDTTSELKTYFREYKTYFNLQHKSSNKLSKRISRRIKKTTTSTKVK